MKSAIASDVRSSIEVLEQRIAPAVLVGVTGHKLIIKGDNAGDTIQIDGVVGSTTNFTVTANTVVTNVTGVTDILINLGTGTDSVTFSNSVAAIDLTGSLTIKGAGGAKSLTTTSMTVGKNVSLSYTNSGTGAIVNNFVDPNIGGNFTQHTSSAPVTTTIYRNVGSGCTIGGNVTIANGKGNNGTAIEDVNIGGNVTITNQGAGSNGSAGYMQIYNRINTNLSVIKGNVLLSDKTGSIAGDGIWDTEVLGNVTINHGSGASTTDFDGYQTELPDIFRKNLTITGTGPATVDVGTEFNKTGLDVGGAFKLTSGAGGDSLDFYLLQVGGPTTITDGKGGNGTTIDDSVFTGAFKFVDAKGTDTINIDTTSNTNLPTYFESATSFVVGSTDQATFTFGGASANELVYAYSTVTITNFGSVSIGSGDIIFPFGGVVRIIA